MGGQNAVDIEIYGFDFSRTDAVAAELAERMRKVKGCSQVNISRKDYIPEYQVDFDREKLAINGLNITTAAMALRNRINGSIASKYREDGDEYDIKVRYAQNSVSRLKTSRISWFITMPVRESVSATWVK